MKKRKTDELGVFNILLVGRNPSPVTAISIADNIHAHFKDRLEFNIVDDLERDIPSNSWFNEFIFEYAKLFKFNNIVAAAGFSNWMKDAKPMERIYMKKLLQAMNTIVVDIGQGETLPVFDADIPQRRFDVERDFVVDLVKWIETQVGKVEQKAGLIRLVGSLCGKSVPYLGDVFGCLSGKKYTRLMTTNEMRFDVPILFDEFCRLSRGMTLDELDGVAVTRTNSALTAFFK